MNCIKFGKLEVKIPDRFSDNFGEPINYLLNFLIQLNEENPTEIYFDFSGSKFISPIIIGGIVAITHSLKNQGKKLSLFSGKILLHQHILILFISLKATILATCLLLK